MGQNLIVFNTHGRQLGKGRLKGCQQLAFQLAVDFIPGIVLLDIAADIGIEKNWIGYTVAVLTKASQGHGHLEVNIRIHYLEGYGIWRAVFIADDFLGVEEINSLILAGIPAEGESLAYLLKYILDAGGKVPGKYGRSQGSIVFVLACLRADIHHLAVFYDYHALPLIDSNKGTIGNNIILPTGIGAAFASTLPPLGHQHIRRHTLTVDIFLPLVSQHTTCCTNSCFNQTHNYSSFYVKILQ